MLHHLEELAERVGIKVRYEAAAGRVGMCVLRGTRVAVIDANLRVPDRVAALASVLAGEELNGVYIPPEIRQRLERSRPLRVLPGDVEPADEAEAPAAGDEWGERDDAGESEGADKSSAGQEADAD